MCNFFGEMFSTYEEFQGKLSEVERTNYSKQSKDHKGFSKRSKWAISSHICLKCCRWLMVCSEVILTSVTVVYYVPMKTSSTPVSRSKCISQKHCRNGEYCFFFPITLNYFYTTSLFYVIVVNTDEVKL